MASRMNGHETGFALFGEMGGGSLLLFVGHHMWCFIISSVCLSSSQSYELPLTSATFQSKRFFEQKEAKVVIHFDICRKRYTVHSTQLRCAVPMEAEMFMYKIHI